LEISQGTGNGEVSRAMAGVRQLEKASGFSGLELDMKFLVEKRNLVKFLARLLYLEGETARG